MKFDCQVFDEPEKAILRFGEAVNFDRALVAAGRAVAEAGSREDALLLAEDARRLELAVRGTTAATDALCLALGLAGAEVVRLDAYR